jgi:hypothetical protein
MERETPVQETILESRWFTFGMLTSTALLISPTFVLGFLSSTPVRATLFGMATVAYGAIFHGIFESQTPVGVPEVTEAYESLALWTAVIGSAAPFVAGWIFRNAWKAMNTRLAVVWAVMSVAALAAGSYAVTQKTDALTAASNITFGRSQVLSALETEASSIVASRPNTPEGWAARFLSSKVAGKFLGIKGPQTIDDFVHYFERQQKSPANP